MRSPCSKCFSLFWRRRTSPRLWPGCEAGGDDRSLLAGCRLPLQVTENFWMRCYRQCCSSVRNCPILTAALESSCPFPQSSPQMRSSPFKSESWQINSISREQSERLSSMLTPHPAERRGSPSRRRRRDVGTMEEWCVSGSPRPSHAEQEYPLLDICRKRAPEIADLPVTSLLFAW